MHHKCLKRNLDVDEHSTWQLIICVNVTGLRDAQRAGNTLFLAVSVCLWRRLAFESLDWVNRLPSLIQVGIIQSAEHLNRRKRQKKANVLFCLSWDIHLLPSDISAPGSQVFAPGLTPAAFLGLLLADSRLGDISASICTGANSYNKSPLIYLSIYLSI